MNKKLSQNRKETLLRNGEKRSKRMKEWNTKCKILAA